MLRRFGRLIPSTGASLTGPCYAVKGDRRTSRPSLLYASRPSSADTAANHGHQCNQGPPAAAGVRAARGEPPCPLRGPPTAHERAVGGVGPCPTHRRVRPRMVRRGSVAVPTWVPRARRFAWPQRRRLRHGRRAAIRRTALDSGGSIGGSGVSAEGPSQAGKSSSGEARVCQTGPKST